MNSHTDLQNHYLESLLKDNDRIDTDTNETLQNGDVISGIGLQKNHTLNQANKSSKPNDINMSVENGCVNGDNCCMNISTGFVIRYQNSIGYTNKGDEFYINKYLRDNNGLPDGVDIDDTLPAS